MLFVSKWLWRYTYTNTENQRIKKTYNLGYKHKQAGEARVVYIPNKVQGIKCYQH